RKGCGSGRRGCGSGRRGCWSWSRKPGSGRSRQRHACKPFRIAPPSTAHSLRTKSSMSSWLSHRAALRRPLCPPSTGDGGGHLDNEEEEVPWPMLSILEDLESREVMVAFFNSAGASAQEKQARLCGQLKEQRVWCQCLTHLVALAQKEPKAVAPAPGTEGESVCGQTHQALQGAMEKLQVSES
uniref:Golgin subfamily A conserved domain-containing protein n=1 Tax=Theropithecus gelada TaxID=9565 RepID=A0A8D2GHS0_THEGE